MKISGVHTVPQQPAVAYQMMQDPGVLARAIPGCESLERVGENEYRMKMRFALASLSGAFEGKVRIIDQRPPQSFRLVVEGSGRIGFVKGDGVLEFRAASNGTEISYEGDAHVGGALAAVGQRLVDGTTKMLLKRFFEALSEA